MTLPPVGEPLDENMVFRLVQFAGVTYDVRDPSALLLFRESEGDQREFTIPISVTDAVTIAAAADARAGVRPSTSELLSLVIDGLCADVIAVRFVRVEGSIVFAELDLMSPNGRRIFDCRPSDAVAVALRAPMAPVLVNEAIVEGLRRG
jgi:bifunctional DNase/RNase